MSYQLSNSAFVEASLALAYLIAAAAAAVAVAAAALSKLCIPSFHMFSMVFNVFSGGKSIPIFYLKSLVNIRM